jgi:hypothetical protein
MKQTKDIPTERDSPSSHTKTFEKTEKDRNQKHEISEKPGEHEGEADED